MSEQETAPEIETVETEIETLPDAGGVVASSQESVEQILWLSENIDRLVAAHNKIHLALLKMTHPADWMTFGEGAKAKTELGFAGANRIASRLGVNFVNWTATKHTGRDERGEWYRYEFECDAMFRGRTVRVFGRFGTRDKFFGHAYGKDKTMAEINEGDVKMAARRACMKEGVKVLFGLHHMDPAYLKENGVNLASATGYEFKDKAKESNGDSGGQAPANGNATSKISEPQQKRLFAILMNGSEGGEDKVEREKTFKKFLVENYKIGTSREIERKDYEVIVKKAEEIASASTVGA